VAQDEPHRAIGLGLNELVRWRHERHGRSSSPAAALTVIATMTVPNT
jgi:hypothetical protein